MELIRMSDPRSESKSLLPLPKHQRATIEISVSVAFVTVPDNVAEHQLQSLSLTHKVEAFS